LRAPFKQPPSGREAIRAHNTGQAMPFQRRPLALRRANQNSNIFDVDHDIQINIMYIIYISAPAKLIFARYSHISGTLLGSAGW